MKTAQHKQSKRLAPLVLLVDDEPKNLKLLGNLLREKNYRMALASDGKRALEIAQAQLPDLILMDVMMPEMSGFEVCKALKKEKATAGIPIIFLTAKSDEKDIVTGFRSGGNDYVVKPLKSEELLARVETHLDLKFSREALQQANDELREINANQIKFFNIVAHDLRNPFVGLKSFPQLLESYCTSFSPDAIVEMAKGASQQAERVLALLENLLHWAKGQMGQVSFEPRRYSLKTLINESVLVADTHIKGKSLKLVQQIEDDIRAEIDFQMVSTIIRNLISNAIKFSREGKTITIAAYANDSEVTIEVHDQGIGMEDKIKNQLFKIGERVTTQGTSGEKGTGLGLLICQQFVERHGGKIWAKSELGQGSSFFVRLPLSQTDDSDLGCSQTACSDKENDLDCLEKD